MKKIILLIMAIFLLAGCDAKWSDVQKNYGDVLNSNNGAGVSCSFYSQDPSDPYGISNIVFNAKYNGLSVSINGGSPQYLWNVDNRNSSIKFGRETFDLDSFMDKLLEYYYNNSKCPDTIFIDLLHNRFLLDRTLLTDQDSPSYTSGKTTITKPSGEKVDCHHTGSNVTCAKYTKEADDYGGVYYLEIGTYDNGIKYFGVSSHENYQGMVPTEYGTDGYNGFSLRYDGYLFQIPSNAINELWLGNGNYASSGSVKISYENFTMPIYYVTGPNSIPNEGQLLFDGGNTVDGPALDPITDMGEEMGDASNVSLPDHVEGMDVCSQNGVKHVLNVAGYLLFAAKIVVPLLLIIFGSMDFAKALTDSDDKGMKDALAKLIRRIIAGVIIFFIPTIFNFIFSLIDDVSNNQNNFTQCSDCLFTPFSGNCNYNKLGE